MARCGQGGSLWRKCHCHAARKEGQHELQVFGHPIPRRTVSYGGPCNRLTVIAHQYAEVEHAQQKLRPAGGE